MPKPTQLKLLSVARDKCSHGGSINAGKRKGKRPFVPRAPIHLVLRAGAARGELSLLRHKHAQSVRRFLKQQASRHHTTVLEWVNVGNHLHLKVRANSRVCFSAFLKSFAALVARAVTGAKRGHVFGRFWDGLAFTRVLKSSIEELRLKKYFTANALETSCGREIRRLFLEAPPALRLTTRETFAFFGIV